MTPTPSPPPPPQDGGVHQKSIVEFPVPLKLSKSPSPFCIPQEILATASAPDSTIHKCFFKDTPREVRIRQIFHHTELTPQEQSWIRGIRDYCRQRNFTLHPSVDPHLLRLCYYNHRKYGDKYITKTFDHLMEFVSWRASMFPISDSEREIVEDLKQGVIYWAARDYNLRPLLVVRLKRLSNGVAPQRFKRLVVFCFEWAMRYLFVPGLVETCIVVFDVRGIAIHSFPISALSDMTTTLTRQYPFRLDSMIIINDSLFIQTVWSIAKQFLTEVQQQKMNFMRTGFEKELLKNYSAHQLEKELGGSRSPIECYYPFPLSPGPFTPGASGPNLHAIPDCHRAISESTSKGEVWDTPGLRPPIRWSQDAPEIFALCNLPPPQSYEQGEIKIPNKESESKPPPAQQDEEEGALSSSSSFSSSQHPTTSLSKEIVRTKSLAVSNDTSSIMIFDPPQSSGDSSSRTIIYDENTCAPLSTINNNNERFNDDMSAAVNEPPPIIQQTSVSAPPDSSSSKNVIASVSFVATEDTGSKLEETKKAATMKKTPWRKVRDICCCCTKPHNVL